MAYTTDSDVFAADRGGATVAGRHPVWAGIGAYRLTPTQIAENVQTARRLGAAGVILFSYDSADRSAARPGYLDQAARAAFAAVSAGHWS